MAKKAIFNNREVTAMLVRYSRHPRSMQLRDNIMTKIYPLIDAAISRKRLFRLRDDLRQECALKVFQNLSKFDVSRGTAFAFLWSAICNVCATQGKRLSRPSLSIEEEDVLKEAESASPAKYLSPEHAHLVVILHGVLQEAFAANGLRRFVAIRDVNVVRYLTETIVSGDFFSDRRVVMKGLRKYKLKKRDGEFFCDYILVTLRTKLYDKREILNGLAAQETSSHLSQESAS